MKTQRSLSIITLTGCLLILSLAACGDESDLPDDPVEEEEEYDVVKYNYHIDGYRSDFVDALGKALGKTPGEEITKEEFGNPDPPSKYCSCITYSKMPEGYIEGIPAQPLIPERVYTVLLQPKGGMPMS